MESAYQSEKSIKLIALSENRFKRAILRTQKVFNFLSLNLLSPLKEPLSIEEFETFQ